MVYVIEISINLVSEYLLISEAKQSSCCLCYMSCYVVCVSVCVCMHMCAQINSTIIKPFIVILQMQSK
jgi:hypothetical protein